MLTMASQLVFYFACLAELVTVRQMKCQHDLCFFMLSSCSFQLHRATADARWHANPVVHVSMHACMPTALLKYGQQNAV